MKNMKNKKPMEKAAMKGMVHLPSKLNIDENDLPELKDWQVGQTYTLSVKAKLMSMKQNDPMLMAEGDSDADKIHAEFEVMGVKTDEEQDEHEKEETESEEEKEHRKKIISKAAKYL